MTLPTTEGALRAQRKAPLLQRPLTQITLLVLLGVTAGVASSRLPVPEFVVLAAFGIAGLGLVVARPMWGLTAMVLLLPIRSESLMVKSPVLDFYIAAYRVVLAFLLFALVVRVPGDWYRRVLRARLTLPLIAITMLGGGSVLMAVDTGYWAKRFLQMVVCFGVYVTVLLLCDTGRKFETICKVLAVAGLLHAAIGVVDYIFLLAGLPSFSLRADVVGRLAPPRARGLMDDPNFYMLIVMCMLCMVPALSLTLRRSAGRYLSLVGLGLLLLLLPMTASRGGALAAVMLLATALALGLRRRLATPQLSAIWVRSAVIGLMIGVPAVVAVVALSPLQVQRLARTLGGEDGVEQAGAGRVGKYLRIVRSVGTYPFGVGLGNTGAVHGGSAHDSFLEILSELGIPGLLTYFWLMFETLRAMVSNAAGSRYSVWLVSISLGIITVYYAGLFLSVYYDEVFALLWGLLMAGNYLADRERAAATGGIATPASA